MDLKDREKVLEDQFFLKQEAKQIAALKDAEEREATREGLRSASGIDDDGVLDKLVEIGISADTLAAVSLVPLVEVAWANGRMQDDERDAILKGAHATGVEEGSGAHELLAGWLTEKPDAELFKAWSGYIEALREQLAAEQLEVLRRQVIDRARAVAAAAGGFLGIKKISDDEERALARLDAAFDRSTS